MLKKPPGCKGCPLEGDGDGFVEGVYPEAAEVLLLGQNPGADEEQQGVPFVGKTGHMLNQTFLPTAGLAIADCARDNTIRCRWQPPGKRVKTNDLPAPSIVAEAQHHCSQYDRPLEQFKLVVLIGDPALQKYYPGFKLSEWRGHLLPTKD